MSARSNSKKNPAHYVRKVAAGFSLRRSAIRQPKVASQRKRTIMINRIIDFSVNNKFIVFALVAAACIAGWWSMKHVALDAIPDLSDTQVIVYSRWDRSPDIIEDQVTYPIVAAMLGAPKVKAVRGFSDFGYSYVYIIFEDGTDIYWARSRTLEYLSAVLPSLPAGRQDRIGSRRDRPWMGLPVCIGGQVGKAQSG